NPTAVVRCGDVNGHAPVCLPNARLAAIGEPDFNYSRIAICLRLWITTCYPQEHFLTIHITRHVHVPTRMGELSQEIHVPVEQFDPVDPVGAVCQPCDGDVVIRCDV